MTIHNKHEIIGKALNILSNNLYPYIEDVIKEFHQENWLQVVQETLKG
ncbi:MAG: hypothetical protein F6K23_20570 [Okeania sp. SIO2C9]|nr:hypothetical protein [Okeania sp. SIO2C9]NEQ75229.1 hypothetical protein [Okeania sp. SIO2C9]